MASCARVPMWIWIFIATSVGPTLARAQESSIEAALPMIRQSGDSRTLCGALTGAAMQHMQANRPSIAAERIDEAIQICRANDDAQSLGTALMIATQILSKLGGEEPKRFLTSLLSESGDNPEIEGQILKVLGQNLIQSGDLVLAIQVFHDYIASTEATAQSSGGSELAWAKWQFGQACMLGKMYDLGVPALKEAKELAIQASDNALAAQCDGAIGSACLRTHEFDTAISFFEKQLSLARQLNQPSAENAAEIGLVNARLGMGAFQEAKTLIDRGIAKGDGMHRGMMQGYAAMSAIAQGDTASAIRLTQQAIESKLSIFPKSVREQVGAQTVMSDQLALAHYHLVAGNLAESMKAADQADAGYQSMLQQLRMVAATGAVSLDASRSALSPIASGISNVRQKVLAAKKEHESALLESEYGRGQAQAEAMRSNFKTEDDPSSESRASIEQLRAIAARENVTFVEYSIARPIDELTQATLASSSGQFDKSELYIWVLDPKGKVSFQSSILEQSLESVVDAARDAILKSDEDESGEDTKSADKTVSSDPIRELAKVLVDPIANFLPTDADAEVVIIPHGELFAVPFAALTDSSGSPLIERHTLSYSCSIELYGLSAQRRGAAKELKYQDILVVGNPTMPAYRFRPDKPASPLDPLPGAEAEAKAIAQILGITALIGDEATEDAVRRSMATAPVIHLATHGLLESDNVFNQSYLSAIALSPNDEENGFLTVKEIMEMKLNADLAVLSACDTGRGRITGEGVVGLSRAYLSAGVPSVVVSLWPVSDAATAVLMVNFYSGLKQGLGKAAALRRATLLNRQKYEDVKLWAPFTLYGVGH